MSLGIKTTAEHYTHHCPSLRSYESGMDRNDTMKSETCAAHKLPLELVNAIIDDFLHSDRPALQACGLTCRAWYPPSRAPLFRRIELRQQKQYTAFKNLLERSPHLGHHVKTLCAFYANAADIECLASTADRLGRVRDLMLLRNDENTASPPISFAQIGPVTRLTILGSFKSMPDDITALAGYLALFPSLKESH